MKALDAIMREKLYEKEASYTDSIALAFQPQSFSHFHGHQEWDEVFRRYTQRDRYRGLDFTRIWSLALNCKRALQLCNGAVAELGIYQGQSASLLSLYAEQASRKIFLCDTFEGFAQEQFEPNMGDGQKAAFKDITLKQAQEVVGDYGGVRWVVGMFPDSVTQEMRSEKFAFVSIDCDIEKPTFEGLAFFWPRLQAGGMIFIHDYSSGHWPGTTKAVDDFCRTNNINGCLLPDMGGTYILVRTS